MNSILIIDQNAVYSRHLKEYLELETNYYIEIVKSIEEADMQLFVFQKEFFACIIDYDLYNQSFGNQLKKDKSLSVILMKHDNKNESSQSTYNPIVHNKKCIFDSQELADTLILMEMRLNTKILLYSDNSELISSLENSIDSKLFSWGITDCQDMLFRLLWYTDDYKIILVDKKSANLDLTEFTKKIRASYSFHDLFLVDINTDTRKNSEQLPYGFNDQMCLSTSKYVLNFKLRNLLLLLHNIHKPKDYTNNQNKILINNLSI